MPCIRCSAGGDRPRRGIGRLAIGPRKWRGLSGALQSADLIARTGSSCRVGVRVRVRIRIRIRCIGVVHEAEYNANGLEEVGPEAEGARRR